MESTVVQDVNVTEGSASPESTPASSDAQPAANGNESVGKPQDAEQAIPYSRFKEINDRYKSVADEFSSYKQQQQQYLQQMQSHFERQLEERLKSFNQPANPEMQLISELKGIRPEFGQLMEKMYNQLNQLQSIPQTLEQQAEERVRQEAFSTLDNLMGQHKVAASERDLYENQIKALIATKESSVDQFGRPIRLTVQDLPGIFNEVHGRFTNFKKEMERSLRESYVKDKTQDATIPPTKPGAPASSKISDSSPMSKSDVISRIAKQIRDAKQAI